MNKLSRVYISNAGPRMAWYDGLLLPFTDSATDDPTHTIFNLVNQGGKTSFLALLFSCIRTKRADFLQTKSSAGQRFEDYFDPSGMPGIIGIEWDLPGDLAAKSRKVVTGQIVAIRRHSEPVECERWFFLMHGAGGPTIEDIPGPNLRPGDPLILKTRDEVTSWLHEQRSTFGEQHFYYTTNQDEWSKALTAVGLDVEMLKHQVDFNAREGAMDEAFLSFKDERDFVRRFLTLTMDGERADSVAAMVQSQCARLSRRKPLEVMLSQVEQFSLAFAPFSAIAREHRDAVSDQQAVQQSIAVAVVTLEERAQEQAMMRDGKAAEEKTQRLAKDEAGDRILAADRSVELLRLTLLDREEKGAGKEQADAKALVAQHGRRLRLLEAAELLKDIRSREQALKAIDAAIDDSNREIAPIRERYRQQAALLREGLRRDADTERRQAAHAKAKATEARNETNRAAVQEGEARRLLGEATTKRVAAQTNLDNTSRARTRLESDGTLTPGESSAEAVERLEAQAEELKEQQRRLEDEAREKAERATGSLQQIPGLAAEKATKDAEAAQLAGQIEIGLDLQVSLRHSSVLCRAVEAELVDPDSEAVPALVEAYILRLQADATQAELELGRLNEDAASVRETGLAGRDPEVIKVVRSLAKAGIKGVHAFPQYLAQVLPDAQRAAQVLESDPARFQGVAVASTEQLDAVEVHLTSLPPVTRPVVISVATDKPAARANDGRIVVSTGDASLYNYEAAKRKGEQFDRLVDEGTVRRNGARESVRVAQDELARLNDYQSRFGNRLATMASTRQQLCDRVSEIVDEIGRLQKLADALRQEAQDAQAKARAIGSQLGRATLGLNSVRAFIQHFESRLQEWQDEVERSAEAEAIQNRVLEGIGKRRQELADAERDHGITAGRHEEAALRHLNEMRAVGDFDEDFDATSALDAHPRTTEDLRRLHRVAQSELSAAELKTVGPLQLERVRAATGLESVEAQFGRASEGLPFGDVEALVGASFDPEKTSTRIDLDAANSDLESANAMFTEAQTRHRDAKAQRKHKAYVEPGVDAMTDVEIRTRLRSREAEGAQSHIERQTAEGAEALAKDARERYERALEKFEAAANQLRSFPRVAGAQPDPLTFANPASAAEEAGKLATRILGLDKEVTKLYRKAQDKFETVRKLALDQEFAKADVELADVLRRNTLDETLDDFERIENAICQRRDVITADLATLDGDFDRAVQHLSQLVREAANLLRRAAEVHRLPDHVPRVAGLTVMTMHKTVLNMTEEVRKERLRPVMTQIAAEGKKYDSGAALATHAILEITADRLGIKLLKVVDMVDEQYVSLERLSKSGAESISMAILLYFVIARLRSEQRQEAARTAEGGVLILDNPFSKATVRAVWEIIVGLADAMGLQLVIATGIQEVEPLSVFRRFLRLAKTHENSVTRRRHIRLADYNFRPQPGAVAAVATV